MTEIDTLSQVTQLVQDLGIWAVFLYLFVNERNAHNGTRNAHMENLREIAGMKVQLGASHEP